MTSSCCYMLGDSGIGHFSPWTKWNVDSG